MLDVGLYFGAFDGGRIPYKALVYMIVVPLIADAAVEVLVVRKCAADVAIDLPLYRHGQHSPSSKLGIRILLQDNAKFLHTTNFLFAHRFVLIRNLFRSSRLVSFEEIQWRFSRLVKKGFERCNELLKSLELPAVFLTEFVYLFWCLDADSCYPA
ncbi:uncharacterized protein BDZ99DRAFT_520653 [Mytilinidion resinicola]|uniref:Uncharacterized protein n=1 Tax=Mytilinidion resinicola TaxID=574789 RepID=A0A6A6YL77_9PEZI|nr:uncharacterized protein BDZ99DRAFT_520653 [Mytilinidion resinicola]KAF2809288.1 hypothetical protein BDZ99DRAFT_520653 [Mytilinidion resinicola]